MNSYNVTMIFTNTVITATVESEDIRDSVIAEADATIVADTGFARASDSAEQIEIEEIA